MKLEDKVFKEVVLPLIQEIRSELYSQSNIYGNNKDETSATVLQSKLRDVKTSSDKAIKQLHSLESWITLLQEDKEK